MKFKIGLFVALLSVSGSSLAQVNALPSTRHILVYGDAQARAIPDRFKIEINFEVIDPKADAARMKVESNVKDVLAKLRAASVSASDIVATSLNIAPRQRYDQDLRKQVFEGIAVTRKLSARFTDQAKLEQFLATLVTSQEIQVSGVKTELSDEPLLNKKLREKTIASTREKAETIARSYGVRLAGLYSVSDVAPQFDYGIREGDWPSSYEWDADEETLDRITVTGSRYAPAAAAPAAEEVESFNTGYVTYSDKIYAVFLITD